MWCLVSQANSHVVEVEVDQKAKGQEVLEKICNILGIRAETDYFGLKYTGAKGVDTWLNLRNPVERQVAGPQPHRFLLRIKFWVPPHLVLQDTTRHQMYLQACVELLDGKLVGDSSCGSSEGLGRLGALLVQAEAGDHPAPRWVYDKWSQALGLQQNLLQEPHSVIEGMKSSVAEYWILKEISNWENFGEELFTCSKGVKVGITPHGINVYQQNLVKIPYTAIKSASSQKRMFQLLYYNTEHEESLFEAKCDSCQAASNLYRALTEKHAFYSCDTVRNAVTSQCIRDLKGTIVSIFNESSPLGKKYVFDIRRTCREVHDNARRALYEGEAKTESGAQKPTAEENMATADKFASLVDALTCRICMDVAIDTVFFPCAHVISCNSCAQRCNLCPLCRSEIETAKRVYLPTSELGLIA